VLLRPGVLTPQQLSEACGETVITPTAPDADAPRASGTLESHYAPMARVQLMSAVDLQKAIDAYVKEAVASNDNAAPTVAVWARSFVQVPATHVHQFACQAMPASAQDCAHQLFAQLRSFDTQGVAYIWVETPPLSPEWDGVRDRLMRAATPTR
jgi:L-threonylcarbamoyladenylate synthase